MNEKNSPILNLPNKMTPRTAKLREMLHEKAKGNRANDWLKKEELPDLSILPKGKKK